MTSLAAPPTAPVVEALVIDEQPIIIPINNAHADAVRALGICWLSECLGVEKPDDAIHLRTLQEVIDALKALREFGDGSGNDKLEKLKTDVKSRFDIALTYDDNEIDPETGKSMWVLRLQKGITAGTQDEEDRTASKVQGAVVTVSQILGEAFELYCAISFKQREFILIIQDRPKQSSVVDSDPSSSTSAGGTASRINPRMCVIEKVLLSDTNVTRDDLKWVDRRNFDRTGYATTLVGNLVEYNKSKEDDAEKLVNYLLENMDADKGFDILVQLKEPDTKKIHFVIVQCKFRSDQEFGVDMAGYVGKHAEITELTRAAGNVTCPFYWMSTNTDFHLAESYFTKLIDSGILVIFGAFALGRDAHLLQMIPKAKNFLKDWKKQSQAGRKKQLAEMVTRPLRKPQEDAVKAIHAHFATKRTDNQVQDEDDAAKGSSGRCASVIMATGSGKTLTAYAATIELETKFKFEKPSLHVSPMIRLVFQNAHEWLAEDIAAWITKKRKEQEENELGEIDYNDFPIYYAVCSGKLSSSGGGTSVITCHMSELTDVLERHHKDNSLHRVRFFTTYHGGSLFWMKVRQFSMRVHGNPLHRVFGVAVRDEAHTAAGIGSKSHAMVLNVPALYSLSFTATPKIQESRFAKRNLKYEEEKRKPEGEDEAAPTSLPENEAVPSISGAAYNQVDETAVNTSGGKEKMTFLHLDSEAMLPSIPFKSGDLENKTCPVYMEKKFWRPFDFLSENLLFTKKETGETGESYDWRYFKKKAEDENKPMVVYLVKPVDTDMSPSAGKYDVLLDPKSLKHRIFGPLFPDNSGSTMELTNNALCFGVTEDFKILCEPDYASSSGESRSRGLVVHDMSPFGNGNYIGPIIHTLSYQECITAEKPSLCGPRLVMLKPNVLEGSEYKSLIAQLNLKQLLGWSTPGLKHTAPDKVRWTLTINGKVVEGSIHQFRAMQQLMDCFKLQDKPVRRAVVFCNSGEPAQQCMDIFNALLINETNKLDFYVCRIFASDVHTQETMNYGEQQEHIRKFGSAKCGVLFNVKLIGIGVDMPGIDAVQIVPAVESVSKIVQGFGRAMRTDSEGKVATFIIPALTPFEQHWKEELERDSKLNAAETPNDTTENEANTHLGSMMPVLSAGASVSAPFLPIFENAYHLQVKLAKLMLDDNVKCISEHFNGTQKEGGSTAQGTTAKIIAYSGNTTEELVKKITCDAPPQKIFPILGEELSQVLLQVWKAMVVTDINGPMLPMPGPKKITPEQFELACAVLAVGLVRSFALQKPKLWNHGYAPESVEEYSIEPEKADGKRVKGKQKKVGEMKELLKGFGDDVWVKAKGRIEQHFKCGFPDIWNLKFLEYEKGKVGHPPKPPQSARRVKQNNGKEVFTIYSCCTIDQLMAKLDGEFNDQAPSSQNTANNATTAVTPLPTVRGVGNDDPGASGSGTAPSPGKRQSDSEQGGSKTKKRSTIKKLF